MGMKEHALAYQKKGFSVIPISPSNKQPMIKFADKPAMTAQEIEDFWSQYPDSNMLFGLINSSLSMWTFTASITDTRAWPIGNI